MSVLDALRGGLVVSVQAPPGSPLRAPEHMAAIARAAEAGGAVAIRAAGAADVAAIRAAVDLPLVGLHKRHAPEGVRITPTLEDARAVADAGADVVAVDATLRPRADGRATAEFLDELDRELGVPLLADVDDLESGRAAAAAGVAAVATTLAGYTGGPVPAGARPGAGGGPGRRRRRARGGRGPVRDRRNRCATRSWPAPTPWWWARPSPTRWP